MNHKELEELTHFCNRLIDISEHLSAVGISCGGNIESIANRIALVGVKSNKRVNDETSAYVDMSIKNSMLRIIED